MPNSKRRPTKFTLERRECILKLVRMGVTPSAAAQTSGIDKSTLTSWRSKAAKGGAENRAYIDFVRALDDAQGQILAEALNVVREAMPKDWRAATWFLERRFPDEFGAQNKIEHSGHIEGGETKTIEVVLVDHGDLKLGKPDESSGE